MDFYDTYFSLQLDNFFTEWSLFFLSKLYFIGIINTFPMYIKMAYTELLELFVPAFVDGLLLQ